MPYPWFDKDNGFNPVRYEQFRSVCNPDRRACCYPSTIGARVAIFLFDRSELLSRIWAYDSNGYAWRSIEFEGVTGWAAWSDQVGLNRTDDNGDPIIGTWDFREE